MALALLTPPVSTTACSRWGDIDVLRVMAAGNPGDAGVRMFGMFVQVLEYPKPVFFSWAVRVRHLPAGRLAPADDPAQSSGPVPGPAHQVGDLRDLLVLLDVPALDDTGC